MPRFRRRFSATRKAKDYVWATSIATLLVAEETESSSLLTSGVWEANPNNFERATLERIVGHISIMQNAAATAGQGIVTMAIVKVNLSYTNGDFDPGLAGDYDSNDVLWSWIGATGESSTGPNLQPQSTMKVDIKVRRKLTSQDQLVLVQKMSSDAAATPEVCIAHLLRLLVNRS